MQRSHWLTLAAAAALGAILVYAFMGRDSTPLPKSAPSAREAVAPAVPPTPSPAVPAAAPERPPGSASTADRPPAPSASAVTAPPAAPLATTQMARLATPPPSNALPPGPVPEGSMLSSTKLPAGQGFTPELEHVRMMLRDFRTIEGENPVGTNAEITKALMGGNKKGAQLAVDAKLNGNGEMVDQWGTPYFFHQLSKVEMEIRSAGPDAMMWTPDDLVTK
jgi:hypothetical protein